MMDNANGAGNAAVPQSDQDLRALQRKSLYIEPGAKIGELEAIGKFLSSLVASKLQTVEIPKALLLYYAGDGNKTQLNSGNNKFTVSFETRGLNNQGKEAVTLQTEQQTHIYLDELLDLLDIVGDWLQSWYTNYKSVVNLGANTSIIALDSLRSRQKQLISELNATKDPMEVFNNFYRTTLVPEKAKFETVALILLEIVDEINPTVVPQAFQYNSLKELISKLNSESAAEELVLNRDAWKNTFLPLLEASLRPITDSNGRQAVQTKEKPSLYTGNYDFEGNFAPLEVKQLFHLFLEKGLRTVVRDPNNENDKLPNEHKVKRISYILTPQEVASINDNSSEFHVEGVDDALQSLIESRILTSADIAVLTKLHEFLHKEDEVMPRLLGEKIKEIEQPEQQEQPAADDRGDDQQQVQVPPQQLTLEQFQAKLLDFVANALLERLPGFPRLAFFATTTKAELYPSVHQLYESLLALVTQELQGQQYTELATQLNPQTLNGLGELNTETGIYTVAEANLTRWYSELWPLILPAIEKLFLERLKTELTDLEQRIAAAISSDELTLAEQQANNQISTDEKKNKLSSLVDEYRQAKQAEQQSGQVGATGLDRARYRDIYIGAANIYAPLLVQQLLEQAGRKDITVEEFLSANPEFMARLTDYFRDTLGSDPEEADKIYNLFFGETTLKLKLIAELRLQVEKDLFPELKLQAEQFITKTIEKKTRALYLDSLKTEHAETFARFNRSQDDLINLIADQPANGSVTPSALGSRIQSLVSLIAQMDDPAAYINRLSEEELLELFGITFKDQAGFLAFKQRLTSHLDLFMITHHGLKDVSEESQKEAGIEIKSHAKLFSSKASTAPSPAQLKNISTMVEAAGGYEEWTKMAQSPYGESEIDTLINAGANEAVVNKRRIFEEQKKLLLLSLWQQLAIEQQQAFIAAQTDEAQAQYQLAAAGGETVPAGFSIESIMQMRNQQEADRGEWLEKQSAGTQFMSSLFRARDTQKGKPQSANAQFAKAATETAIKTGLNVIAPGAGEAAFLARDFLKAIGIDEKTLFLMISSFMAGTALLLSYLLNPANWGNLIGGAVRGIIQANPFGWGGGSTIARAGALNPAAAGLGKAGAGVGKAAGTVSGTPTTPIGAGTGFFSNIGASATTMVIGGTVATAAVVSTVSNASLLQPLPTISGDQISPYVEIIKTATPNIEFENAELSDIVTVTYTITIKAKEGYNITVTNLTDSMSVRTNAETRNNVPEPTLPLAKTLTDFEQQAPLQINSGESLVIGSYTQDFGPEYQDSNIVNTVNIDFTVAQGEGFIEGQSVPIPTTAQKAMTAESICFGACPQAQGGCWPVAGFITQLPFNGGGSHAVTDSFDIGVPAGTPVFSPFNGTIVMHTDSNTGFGVSVKISATLNGREEEFVFAHLTSPNEAALSRGTVEVGDLIGLSGSTGNSTGPHLHYELLTNERGGSSRLRDYVPDGANVGMNTNTRPVCEKP